MWLQHKFAKLMSVQFDRWSEKNKTYNFRCPYCGDSQKNRFKARGYLWDKGKGLVYSCHNCGITRTFDNFLKEQDPHLHKSYLLEKLAEKSDTNSLVFGEEPEPSTPVESKYTGRQFKLKKVSQLAWNHPAKLWVDNRKIPSDQQYRLYYCPKFNAWTNTYIPGKLNESKEHEEPRLVIPFFDESGKLFGYQGRSFDPNSSRRYITIMLDKRPNIFGLDVYDASKKVYVVEGPIDSLFVDNSIAMAGSDADVSFIKDPVIVYDNEPRSTEINKKISKTIGMNLPVVIWPAHIEEKDINDMVLSGVKREDIMQILKANTYQGLKANLAHSIWRKDVRIQNKGKASG